MDGAAGPSGLDSSAWKRLCSSFSSLSMDLCNVLAALARKLGSSYVDPVSLSPLVASRLIALDKNPGVHPIAIGEVCRRILGKAILRVIKTDIPEAAGCLQLCAGQDSGCEVAVHCVRKIFQSDDTEGMLFADATNAFNLLNREVALRNILHLCPSLGRALINTYRMNIDLFIDGDALVSREGTLQGDPLAMAMFAIASLPLIRQLRGCVRQTWYADDASAGGSLSGLKNWWDKLIDIGPAYGYFPNPLKTRLLVKEEHLEKAEEVFMNTGIQVTTDGTVVLGSPIGSESFMSSFI